MNILCAIWIFIGGLSLFLIFLIYRIYRNGKENEKNFLEAKEREDRKKKEKEKEKLISCLNSQETEKEKKKGEKPCSDLSEKEEQKEDKNPSFSWSIIDKKDRGGGNKEPSPCLDFPKTEELKEEKRKLSSDSSKTTPRSYSSTLPGFDRIQREKPSSYSDLLKTEEWRNKRLKIIKRDNCRCVYCGNRFHLHVHHKYYSAYPNGVLVDPWNYPDDALITLCSYCHQRVHARKKIKVYHRRYTDNY